VPVRFELTLGAFEGIDFSPQAYEGN